VATDGATTDQEATLSATATALKGVDEYVGAIVGRAVAW
jgi:hypothetical protein